MPVVVMPSETAQRLKSRLLLLGESVDIRMFHAKQLVLDLQFTAAEIEAFGGETGPAVVVAVKQMGDLDNSIPAKEDGKLNYIPVSNLKALDLLDPFN